MNINSTFLLLELRLNSNINNNFECFRIPEFADLICICGHENDIHGSIVIAKEYQAIEFSFGIILITI